MWKYKLLKMKGDPDLPENLPRIMPFRACVRPSSRKTRQRVMFQNIPMVTFWSLPDEILLELMGYMHIKDLLALRKTHPYLRDLINKHISPWKLANFADCWPTQANVRHWIRAAQRGNIESLVKLGIAYLYNEGLPGDYEGRKITTNGENAARMFCGVERMTPNTPPFTWLFIRPPWASTGACCKECVFNNMKTCVAKKFKDNHNVHVCIAKTLLILGDESKTEEMEEFLKKGIDGGSNVAPFMMWEHKNKDKVLDVTQQLHNVRELRQIANKGYLDAQLALCRYYCKKMFGGIKKYQAELYVRDFIQSSKPTNVDKIYTFEQLTHSMRCHFITRYILIDWLVEVANMKDFGTLTLHVAIDVVDRYLRTRGTTRAKLQLLGVSSMVLCSRFLGKDIITIREAAWLTDNTYKYEDVVRMMGEITATLKGNLRNVISLDYVDLINVAAENDEMTIFQSHYIIELALLQSELGKYPKAMVAAAAVLLARLAQKKDDCWPPQLKEFTGWSIDDVRPCLYHMHCKCFVERCLYDHRNVELQAVRQRYADKKFLCVSELEMLTKLEICSVIGWEWNMASKLKEMLARRMAAAASQSSNLIKSPSRKDKEDDVKPPETMTSDREQAATPNLDQSLYQRSLNESAAMNQSSASVSGYDADLEGDESIIAGFNPDGEFDGNLASLIYDPSLNQLQLNEMICHDCSHHLHTCTSHLQQMEEADSDDEEEEEEDDDDDDDDDDDEPESFSFLRNQSNSPRSQSAPNSPRPSTSSFSANLPPASHYSPPPGLVMSNFQYLTPSPVSGISHLFSPPVYGTNNASTSQFLIPGARSPIDPSTISIPGARSPINRSPSATVTSSSIFSIPGSNAPIDPSTIIIPGARSPINPSPISIPGAHPRVNPSSIQTTPKRHFPEAYLGEPVSHITSARSGVYILGGSQPSTPTDLRRQMMMIDVNGDDDDDDDEDDDDDDDAPDNNAPKSTMAQPSTSTATSAPKSRFSAARSHTFVAKENENNIPGPSQSFGNETRGLRERDMNITVVGNDMKSKSMKRKSTNVLENENKTRVTNEDDGAVVFSFEKSQQ